jgi:4-hydroxy-4-methyl-2-oxoglutarate aldolase
MMKTIVVRNIPRAPTEVIEALAAAGVATVHEAMGRAGLMQHYMRPVYEGAAAAGSAVTVLAAPGDNWMLHVAVEVCQPGDMLVVACMTENTDGMVGDLLATSLQTRGVRGVVIDAGARDIKTLRAMQFPVWSRAVSARGTVKATIGNVNLPVVCAGAQVHPGDVIVADDDGVVVVPLAEAARVAELAGQRTEKEERARARFLRGELSLDSLGLRPKLQAGGLRYIDSIEDL